MNVLISYPLKSHKIWISKYPIETFNNLPEHITYIVCAEIHRCNLSIVLMGPQCPVCSAEQIPQRALLLTRFSFSNQLNCYCHHKTNLSYYIRGRSHYAQTQIWEYFDPFLPPLANHPSVSSVYADCEYPVKISIFKSGLGGIQ